MKHVFIPRKGDRESLAELYREFKSFSDQTLLKYYNRQVNTGITGVHAQAIHLLALHKAFMQRYNQSPIVIEDNIVISLSGKQNTFPL